MNRTYNALDMNTFMIIPKQVFILIPVFILICPVKYVAAGETLPGYHQVYPIIDALQARAHLVELSQLSRPYSRADVLHSANQCLENSKQLSTIERAWLQRIVEELNEPLDNQARFNAQDFFLTESK